MHYIVIAITFLATFLADIFTRSVGVFFEIMTKRVLIITACVAVLAAFVVGFYALMLTIINSISANLPPFFSQAASMVVPDNFVTLASITITAHIARWAYEWNVKVLQWRL